MDLQFCNEILAMHVSTLTVNDLHVKSGGTIFNCM